MTTATLNLNPVISSIPGQQSQPLQAKNSSLQGEMTTISKLYLKITEEFTDCATALCELQAKTAQILNPATENKKSCLHLRARVLKQELDLIFYILELLLTEEFPSTTKRIDFWSWAEHRFQAKLSPFKA